MRKKILQNLLLLVLGSILITMLLGGALMYRNTINQVQQDLQQDVAYLRQNLLMEPGRLNFPSSPLTRITLIDTQGKVVYDSEANHDAMENHEHRPEVQAAQRDGHGSADRVSATVGKRDFYYAERLADGRILRVARSADDMFSTMISFIPWLVLMGLGIGFLAYLVAVRLTNKLIAPLEDVNLDQPLSSETYDELAPFLLRIAKQNRALRDAANLRREFTANVSHELKTPLQSISGYAEIINAGIAKPEDVPRFVAKIRSEAARLIEMVDNILKLSRLDEGGLEDQLQNIDLKAIVVFCCQRLEEQARAQQVELVQALPEKPVMLRCVPAVVDEIVFNLVENAIKYNQAGGRVTVSLPPDPEGAVQLRVRDTGKGIAKEDQQRIFERFYRGEKSHTGAIPGSGLGLALVKHGVLLHKGTINLASTPGEGTEITVIFGKL
jgi:two-component system phosphate regulon sensor histidine kinase PhoR